MSKSRKRKARPRKRLTQMAAVCTTTREDAPPIGELPSLGRAYFLLGTLIAAYVGVYLCRRNLSVAVPILQQQWGLSKAQVGMIGSVSTICYACGKFLFGPVTDRVGGRTSLLSSMGLVAAFGVLGGFAPGLATLTLFYSCNRLFGAASWGAMVKLVPEWFGPSHLAFACGLLSLSFVFGGALGVALAGLVASLSHDSALAVLAFPSIILALVVAGCWVVLPRPVVRGRPVEGAEAAVPRLSWRELTTLFKQRQFLITLSLSFTLTMLRETFNFWTVDFIRTEGGASVSNAVAAYVSTPFDLCGAAGIVLMGWAFGRLGKRGRRNLLALMLLALAVFFLLLPMAFKGGLPVLAAGVGLIGFLVYGPYSLLGGVLSVEVRGKEYAATVSGWVDGAGYIAGIVSGAVFGKLLTLGGYTLGFAAMAVITLISAGLCCFLYPKEEFKLAAGAPVLEVDLGGKVNGHKRL